MTRSRVFVVNEPLLRDDSGNWRKFMNFYPANEHGELVHLLPAGPLPSEPTPTVNALKKALTGFRAEDCLLPVGDMRAVAWACAIAANLTGGRLRVLSWVKSERRYEVSTVNLFADDAAERRRNKQLPENAVAPW